MIKLYIDSGLPFAEIILLHNNKHLVINKALIDTGSMSTIISTDYALELDLQPEANDTIRPIRGVGGIEYVYEKNVDTLKIDTEQVSNYKLQIGAMDYGFNINAIVGFDLLSKAKIILDTGNQILFSSNSYNSHQK